MANMEEPTTRIKAPVVVIIVPNLAFSRLLERVLLSDWHVKPAPYERGRVVLCRGRILALLVNVSTYIIHATLVTSPFL